MSPYKKNSRNLLLELESNQEYYSLKGSKKQRTVE